LLTGGKGRSSVFELCLAAEGGGLKCEMDLDQWISKVKDGQHLLEDELQLLCEYVRTHTLSTFRVSLSIAAQTLSNLQINCINHLLFSSIHNLFFHNGRPNLHRRRSLGQALSVPRFVLCFCFMCTTITIFFV